MTDNTRTIQASMQQVRTARFIVEQGLTPTTDPAAAAATKLQAAQRAKNAKQEVKDRRDADEYFNEAADAILNTAPPGLHCSVVPGGAATASNAAMKLQAAQRVMQAKQEVKDRRDADEYFNEAADAILNTPPPGLHCSVVPGGAANASNAATKLQAAQRVLHAKQEVKDRKDADEYYSEAADEVLSSPPPSPLRREQSAKATTPSFAAAAVDAVATTKTATAATATVTAAATATNTAAAATTPTAELRTLLDSAEPPLTHAQKSFCNDITLDRYLYYWSTNKGGVNVIKAHAVSERAHNTQTRRISSFASLSLSLTHTHTHNIPLPLTAVRASPLHNRPSSRHSNGAPRDNSTASRHTRAVPTTQPPQPQPPPQRPVPQLPRRPSPGENRRQWQ